MPPKFGTSGLRGLVTELTPDLVGAHVAGFIAACPVGTGLWIGRDLRGSSPDISDMIAQRARAMGVDVTDCGAIPTPALALAAMQAGAGAVMITGSHIPADRNGLKFYTPQGEITKDHEAAILAHLDAPAQATRAQAATGALHHNDTAAQDYCARYVTGYGARALSGLRIGNYAHSAVGRDLTADILRALGAEVVDLGRSEVFVPVDTEAVDPDTRAQLQTWAATGLDAVVSTDGDGDRPLMADHTGTIVVGDVLGQITAASLNADTVVTPVSSNTGAEGGGAFARVIRTRIGSPFVIAGMQTAPGKTVGYEANGGFLLGFDADGPTSPLPALMTRDSLLPLIAPLAAARAQGLSLAALVARQPARFTAADRLQDVPTDTSKTLVQSLISDADARTTFTAAFASQATALDTTDGLRMTLEDGRILHLRPSGNAPELRLYVEADSLDAANHSLQTGLALLRRMT